MGQKIKTFADESYLEYDQGSFDEWCVYLTKSDGIKRPPKDTDYFSRMRDFANKYGSNRIYNDYVRVYDLTGKQVEKTTLSKITVISASYGNDALEIDVILSILYLAMISEERKKNTRLGKRIKRLGIHKLLIENQSVSESANFMRGMKWYEIDKLCTERGF